MEVMLFLFKIIGTKFYEQYFTLLTKMKFGRLIFEVC